MSTRKVYTIGYELTDANGTFIRYEPLQMLASPHWAGTEPELVVPRWTDRKQALLAARAHNAYLLCNGKAVSPSEGGA